MVDCGEVCGALQAYVVLPSVNSLRAGIMSASQIQRRWFRGVSRVFPVENKEEEYSIEKEQPQAECPA